MASLPNIIKGLWPSKIRTQLICGVALVHLLLMSFFVFDLVGRQRDFLGQQSLEQSTSLAETLALNSSSWVLTNDVVGLEEIVLAVGKYPGLRYAMVITTDGEVLAHTDKSHVGQRITDEKSRILLNAEPHNQILHADQNILDVAAPILTNSGNIIGWARIAQGQEKIADNLVIISRNGILYTLIAIVAGSLFAVLLGNRLTAGLNRLLIVANQVRDGRRDLRMAISRHDEVALLGEGFNKMLDAIVANENLILLNQLRLESLANIFQFQAANQQELLDYALEQAINLTDSRFGYISYYDEEKQEFTLNSWSREVMQECTLIEPITCYQLDKTGLWGEAVRQRKPILVNDFQAENPLKKGYPQGHAELYNYLTIPVFQKKRIVAVVAVANTAQGYDHGDITRLTLLMEAVWKLVERRQAEESLRASESLIKSFSKNFTAGMIYQVVITRDGTRRFTYVSDSVKQLYGVSPEEAIADATLIYSRAHKDDIQSLIEAENEAARTCSTFTAEVRIIEPSGKTRWSSMVSTPTKMEDGSIYWNGIELIITERKEVEQALEQAAREWSAAMDASDDIIYLLNLERHIVRANKTFYLATGTTPETAIGRHIVEVIHPQGEAVPCPVCCAQEEKRDLQIVMEAEHPDNPVARPLEITVKIIRNHEEHPISIFMTLHDLSASRKEMEEKISLERQLQQAQKMESVGRLAGGVAHDFNNMLGVIIGHAEIAMNQVDPDQPLHASLAEIHMAAQRSADLTRQLLAFARKQTVAPKVLDLNETVAGMLNMLRRLIGENIVLNWQPAANLWLIKMDPSQIDQILANLCINARDSITGIGELIIETGNRTLDDAYCATHLDCMPGEYVLLTVSDTGCGMDKATLAQIFEPFFTTKDLSKGTGLGLSTVYGAIKQNNGFINTYSEPGQGTTFTIYLPRHMGQAEQTRTEGVAEPSMGGQETILLVEDEPTILHMTTIMLEGLGYTVLAASTPDMAIRLAREHIGEISLLMTDVVMPEINGRDLAEKLLSLDPHLKSLFMSGYTADIIAHHGILDERAHFLQKPFSTNDLAIKVREALTE
ncbi:MAG: GAF domain-containing protein [Deltaproteobacteria bacterium]|nr:GAF domain-containing protein [Deltaproteobacteria bacterium]